MDIIALTPGTDLANIVKLVSKKRKAILARPTTEVRLTGTYWSEGSRSEYFMVNIKTKEIVPMACVAPPQYGGPKEDPVAHLQPGFAIIEAGIFCGKPATPTIYLHPMWGQDLIEEVK